MIDIRTKIIEEDIKTIAESIKPIAGKLAGSTLLITGGAGFLGKYFVWTLDYLNKNILEKPCTVILVDNFITGTKELLPNNEHIKIIHHNVIQPLDLDEPIDYILHAASIASPVFYKMFKLETLDVGTLGTKNMLELAVRKKVKGFMFFSSSEIYGDPDPKFIPTPETYLGNCSCTGPRACYDEAKRFGETLCINYHEIYQTPIRIVRPFNIYGPGMRLDDYRVIPNFTANILKGKPLPVYGKGDSTRTFCYITDAMEGFFKILLSEHACEIFNIGNDQGEISMLELAKKVTGMFDNKVNINHIVGPNDAYSKADPQRRCPDLTKIKTKLGYQSKIDIETGLKRFMTWVLEWYGAQTAASVDILSMMNQHVLKH